MTMHKRADCYSASEKPSSEAAFSLMGAEQARKESLESINRLFNQLVSNLLGKAIAAIKGATVNGKYHARISTQRSKDDDKAITIVAPKLEALGYKTKIEKNATDISIFIDWSDDADIPKS